MKCPRCKQREAVLALDGHYCHECYAKSLMKAAITIKVEGQTHMAVVENHDGSITITFTDNGK